MASIVSLLAVAACVRGDDTARDKGDTPDDTASIGDGPDTGCVDSDGDGSCPPSDCDDGDAAVHPGALDADGDDIDTDCDGFDGAVVRALSDDDTWRPSLPTGEAGQSLVAGPDVDGDGLPDIIVGAPVYATYPYDSDAVDGTVTVLARNVEPIGSWTGTPASRAGIALAIGGDLDGDGVEDIVIGSMGEQSEGRAWIVGDLLGNGALIHRLTAEIVGENGAYNTIRETFAISPDLTGDARPDLLLRSVNSGIYDDSDICLFAGPLPPLQGVEDAALVLTGAQTEATGAVILARSDLDADGAPDLVASAFLADAEAGRIYLLPGPLSGSGPISDALVQWVGAEPGAEAGYAMGEVPDADGDGIVDLLVGAALDDRDGVRGGRAYLVPGASPSGVLDNVALVTFVPDRPHRFLGAAFASGDIDGDGTHELLVGAPDDWYFPEGPGEVWIYRAPIAGTLSREHAWRILRGAHPADVAGVSIATADIDGDGLFDIAVGAPGDDEVGLNAGKVYLVMGSALAP